MSYEFKGEDEDLINSVSILGIIIAGLIAIRGTLDFVDTMFLSEGLSTANMIVFSVQEIIQVISGLVFIPAALSFRRIVTTEGEDISELLDGLDRLTIAFFVLIALIVVSAILDVMSILA